MEYKRSACLQISYCLKSCIQHFLQYLQFIMSEKTKCGGYSDTRAANIEEQQIAEAVSCYIHISHTAILYNYNVGSLSVGN